MDLSSKLSLIPEPWLRWAIGRSGRFMLGRNLPDLRELAEVGKILAWLGFARPLPRHVDSRPPGPAFDAFPTSTKHPGGKSAARPPRKPPGGIPDARPPRSLRAGKSPPDLREKAEVGKIPAGQILARPFGLGTFLGQFLGPEKHTFAGK